MSKPVTWAGLLIAVIVVACVFFALDSAARSEKQRRMNDFARQEAARVDKHIADLNKQIADEEKRQREERDRRAAQR